MRKHTDSVSIHISIKTQEPESVSALQIETTRSMLFLVWILVPVLRCYLWWKLLFLWLEISGIRQVFLAAMTLFSLLFICMNLDYSQSVPSVMAEAGQTSVRTRGRRKSWRRLVNGATLSGIQPVRAALQLLSVSLWPNRLWSVWNS